MPRIKLPFRSSPLIAPCQFSLPAINFHCPLSALIVFQQWRGAILRLRRSIGSYRNEPHRHAAGAGAAGARVAGVVEAAVARQTQLELLRRHVEPSLCKGSSNRQVKALMKGSVMRVQYRHWSLAWQTQLELLRCHVEPRLCSGSGKWQMQGEAVVSSARATHTDVQAQDLDDSCVPRWGDTYRIGRQTLLP